MRMSTGGCWLAVGLLGCSPNPSEVVGPYSGTGGSSGSGTEGSPTSGEPDDGTTGPIAEGSAGSGTPTTMADTTAPVDPVTTDPDTSTSGEPPTESTSGEGSSSGDPPPLTCEQLFGTADGYTPCEEDETSCTFALYSNGADCNTICGMFGQPCIGGIDNPDGLNCNYGSDLPCNQAEQSEGTICICAK